MLFLFNSYGNCYVNRDSIPTQNSFSYPVINTLRSLMHRLQGRIPRLLMFGSGLESIPLVRLMIMEKDSPYQPVGLFPGKEGEDYLKFEVLIMLSLQ